MRVAFNLAVFLTCLAVSFCIECPEGFINLQDRCYLFSQEKANWLDSAKSCAQLNSYLIALETEEEANAIHAHMKKLKNDNRPKNIHYWVGGTDRFKYRHFVWTGTWKDFTYNNWCQPNEPNDYQKKGEHCVEIGFNDYDSTRICWNDLICTEPNRWDHRPLHYICETDPVEVVVCPLGSNGNSETPGEGNKVAYEIEIHEI